MKLLCTLISEELSVIWFPSLSQAVVHGIRERPIHIFSMESSSSLPVNHNVRGESIDRQQQSQVDASNSPSSLKSYVVWTTQFPYEKKYPHNRITRGYSRMVPEAVALDP